MSDTNHAAIGQTRADFKAAESIAPAGNHGMLALAIAVNRLFELLQQPVTYTIHDKTIEAASPPSVATPDPNPIMVHDRWTASPTSTATPTTQPSTVPPPLILSSPPLEDTTKQP